MIWSVYHSSVLHLCQLLIWHSLQTMASNSFLAVCRTRRIGAAYCFLLEFLHQHTTAQCLIYAAALANRVAAVVSMQSAAGPCCWSHRLRSCLGFICTPQPHSSYAPASYIAQSTSSVSRPRPYWTLSASTTSCNEVLPGSVDNMGC